LPEVIPTETRKEDDPKECDEDEPELEEGHCLSEEMEVDGRFTKEADSWAQFKQQQESVASPPSQQLSVEPIIKPQDCTSFSEFLIFKLSSNLII
jgi:hypothetical protein